MRHFGRNRATQAIDYRRQSVSFPATRGTYRIPLHDVQTKDPIVMSTYVGPLWWQSKHCLLWGRATISRNILRCFSSCFLLFDAISTVRRLAKRYGNGNGSRDVIKLSPMLHTTTESNISCLLGSKPYTHVYMSLPGVINFIYRLLVVLELRLD